MRLCDGYHYQQHRSKKLNPHGITSRAWYCICKIRSAISSQWERTSNSTATTDISCSSKLYRNLFVLSWGELKSGGGNAVFKFRERRLPLPLPAPHNIKIDSYKCLAVDSLTARTERHEIISGFHVMLVCITLLLIVFPSIWSIRSRSNHQITNQWVFWSFQSATQRKFWSSAFSARGTTMEQIWMGTENSKCLF